MDDELLNDFIEESIDLLEKIKSALSSWESTSDKVETINSIYRWVHTIKGGCGIFNYTETASIAHALETYLGDLKKSIDSIDESNIDYISDEVERIEDTFNSQRNGVASSSQVVHAENNSETSFHFNTKYFAEYYESMGGMIQDLVIDGFSFFEIILPKELAPVLTEKLKEHGFAPFTTAEHAEGLACLCSVMLAANPKYEGQVDNLVSRYKGQWCTGKSSQKESQRAKESVTQTQGHVPQEVLRVPLDTVNSILDHVWELFLVRNQMNHLMQQNKQYLKDHHSFVQLFESLDAQLERNINELESKTMSMRLSPIKKVFDRMEKVVEEYCQKNQKEIQLEIGGAGIDLDKKVLDQLNEPLIHLIRNAIDHGIEDSFTRETSGKNPVGKVTLNASMHGNEVHIAIKDDGKGIDAQKILASAKKKGLEVDHLTTDQEIIELIFASGFSTAEQVTDVSGRGVGMDAVKKSILELGGNVTIDTKVGEGSTFTIALPLTMSVSKCLIVEIKGLEYGISTKSVLSLEKISTHSLKKNGFDEYYEFNGELLPCYELEVSGKDYRKEPDLPVTSIHVCVTRIQDKLVAFKVDNILQTLNVVIKPLPALMKKHSLLSGVSILPAGNPIFILNVYENLLRLMHDKSGGKNAKRSA